MSFSLVACGANENEELYAERSIDGIAECLGYTDGKELGTAQLDEVMAGALAGKDYGDVIIYEFDPQSEAYKHWANTPDMCNEGFILMISGDLPGEDIADLSIRFKKIKFN